jgi:membrane associated rhomboid family serine protease
MFIPIGVDNPLKRVPYANWAVIAVCVLTFFVGLSSEETEHKLLVNGGIWAGTPQYHVIISRSGTGIGPAPQNSTRIHQFVTHAFLHVNFWHLLGNMIFLFVFGNNINDALGHAKFIAVYLAIAVAGGLCHVLQYSGQSPAVPAVGASGAIAGVVGIYMILYPRNDVKVMYFIGFYPRTFFVSSIWIILLWIGFDAAFAFFGLGSVVAYWVHVVGFALGVGLATALLKLGWVDVGGWDIFSWVKEGTRQSDRILGRMPRYGVALRASGPGLLATGGSAAPPQEYERAIDGLLAKKQIDEALRMYEEFRNAYPSRSLTERPLVALAVELARLKQRDKAVAILLTCLNAYPEGVLRDKVCLNLGLLLAGKPDHQQSAREYLETAIRITQNPRTRQIAEEKLAQLAVHPPPGGTNSKQ